MKIIVGFGNPGEKYKKTRHNMGFMVLDKLASSVERLGSSWKYDEKFKSEILKINYTLPARNASPVGQRLALSGRQSDAGGNAKPYPLVLAKPKTFMNNSGQAVQLLTSYFKLLTSDVWVIHDDIDLPLGSIRIRLGGSFGGHRGVESVIEKLGTDKFWRFRLGINSHLSLMNHELHKKERIRNVEDYVLGEFPKEEEGKVKDLVERGAKAMEKALKEGLESAMNKYNR